MRSTLVAIGCVCALGLLPGIGRGRGACLRPMFPPRPATSDLALAYPPQALRAHVQGAAVLTCHQTAYGRLVGCAVRSEAPAGYGFGAAALKLAPTLARGGCADAPDRIVRRRVSVPIQFRTAG